MGGRDAERDGGSLKVRPFRALEALRDALPEGDRDRAPEERPDPPRLRGLDRLPEPEREAVLLARALDGVEPLRERTRVARGRSAAPPRTVDEDRAVRDHLRDLVDGALPFDIADTDEFIEGAAQGLDRRILRRLRRGELSVQDHLDLHGLNREEARDAVARFVRSAVARGLRCVLVVHGRGLRSKDQIPVLKEKLKAWLTRGSIGASVLAFTTARPYDGGTGAVYVLLRR